MFESTEKINKKEKNLFRFSSSYRGVCYDTYHSLHKGKDIYKCQASIIEDGVRKQKHLGLFLDEISAAKAYDSFCKKNKIKKVLNFKRK